MEESGICTAVSKTRFFVSVASKSLVGVDLIAANAVRFVSIADLSRYKLKKQRRKPAFADVFGVININVDKYSRTCP